MIIVRLKGGLGNQLFQYALGRYGYTVSAAGDGTTALWMARL